MEKGKGRDNLLSDHGWQSFGAISGQLEFDGWCKYDATVRRD